MVAAICKELEIQKNYLGGEPLETVYFGGGTPSLLQKADHAKIFDSIHKNFVVLDGAEITLEANPDDLNRENLKMLKELGVNRLSIGIQSFDDRVLRFLNRAHSAAEGSGCVRLAREVGFHNISIDLIYAIPGQDEIVWGKNIEQAISIFPEHISAYALTIEEKTVFGNWLKSGRLNAAPDEVAASQMEVLITLLGAAGYEHYEISNFSKPDLHARHNSNYWKQRRYLGVGPSAHSYNTESRQYNIKNNSFYVKAIAQGHVPFEKEVLSRADHINEYLLTTLRTSWGCDLGYLAKRFDFDLLKEKGKEFRQFQELLLLERNGDVILLTQKGKLLADKIAADFFVDKIESN